jgi:beta-lactamase class A
MRISLLVVLVAVVAGLSGFYLHDFPLFQVLEKRTAHEIRQSGSTLVNPLLDCEVDSEQAFHELLPFKDSIAARIEQLIHEGKADYVSLYFRDLANGPWMGVNESDTFSPGSLVKVPLMMSVFQLAQSDPTFLGKTYEYTGEIDNTRLQNVLPSQNLEIGKQYSVDELVRRMIVYSDIMHLPLFLAL